jgi:hypothetical protein
MLSFVYVNIGASSKFVEFLEGNVEAGFSVMSTAAFVWHPSSVAVRKTKEFKPFARKAGYVDYWKNRGWPDLCRPVSADDFICE